MPGNSETTDRGESSGKLHSSRSTTPVWEDDKHFISMSQRKGSEEGLFERRLDLSQKNVSHMVEVQK